MKNEFVTYEQSLALKELGFDDECCGYYSDNILYIYEIENKNLCNGAIVCALKQQVFRWFREKYGLVAEIGVNYFHPDRKYGFGIFFLNKKSEFERHPYEYTTYEEAENACIDKLTEIAKQQDK